MFSRKAKDKPKKKENKRDVTVWLKPSTVKAIDREVKVQKLRSRSAYLEEVFGQ